MVRRGGMGSRQVARQGRSRNTASSQRQRPRRDRAGERRRHRRRRRPATQHNNNIPLTVNTDNMINNDNDRQVLSEIANVEVNNLQVESQTNLAANSSQEENNSNSADEFVADDSSLEDELIEEDSNDEIEEGELIEEDSSDESEEDDVDPARNLFHAFVEDDNDEDTSSSSSESSIHQSENDSMIADQSDREDISIDESYDDDDDIVRCAICFNKHDPNNKWRCLVTLPCCGDNGKEENSSTRFCAACILHLAHNVRPGQIADDEVPHYRTRTRDLEMTVRFFYEHDSGILYVHVVKIYVWSR